MRSAICWSVRLGQRRQREKADRQHPFGPRQPCRRGANDPRDGSATSGGRSRRGSRLAVVSITVEVDELASMAEAHFFSARCWRTSLRATCRSTRSLRPPCERLAGAKSIAGCRSGARDRHSRTVQPAAESPHAFDFYLLRMLECLFAANPRWGHARRPADEAVRFGQEPELTFAPAPLASFGTTGRASAAAGAPVRTARTQRSATTAHHRVRARADAPRRRPDVEPLPRHLPSPVRHTVLPGVGAGAAARQSRSAG